LLNPGPVVVLATIVWRVRGKKLRRRITSRFVALMLGSVLTADALAVTQLRAQERDQAAAVERAVDQAWVGQVRQIAVDLQAARAPISDAANVTLGDIGPGIRYDVYVRGSALADFNVQAQRLADVDDVPAARRGAQRDLSVAMKGMTDAVRQLAEDKSSDIEDELRLFLAHTKKWDATIMEHVARDVPLATTLRGDLPLTATGYLYRWSRACGQGLLDDEDLGDPGDDRVKAAHVLKGYARNLDATLDALLAVPSSAAEPGVAVRDLEPALRGLRDGAKSMHSLADALAARDRAGLSRSLVLIDRVAPLFEAASEAFQVAGSEVCAEYFDPGVLSAEGRDLDDLSRT
jgi:hypothetical protein